MTTTTERNTLTEEMSLLPAAKRIAEQRGLLAKVPASCDSFALRVCRADFTSTHGFRWPFPGNWAKCPPGVKFSRNNDPCPSFAGDGLCLARTWSGAASGGTPADLVLLVAYAAKDVLARSDDKLRVKRAYVADVFTFVGLVAERHEDEAFDLSGANLRRAGLSGADLSRANLRGADLRRADLRRAGLSGADLSRANLRGADLSGANLRGADFSGADFSGANLTRADLRRADLRRADLFGANLRRADLFGANLSRANNKQHAIGLAQ